MGIDHSGSHDTRVAEPGRGPEVLSLLQAAAEVLDEVPGAVHQLGEDEEGDLVTALLRLQGRSARLVTLVAGRTGRGRPVGRGHHGPMVGRSCRRCPG